MRSKTIFAALGLGLMTLANPVLAETKIKNVIMLIGDGMGPQQMGLLEAYARRLTENRQPGLKSRKNGHLFH
ncbi:hypothetical protein [Endozoicomonas numazuensis]|uniref:hypothetical protein n=1 Tax=Endozoicomonas numazuensis TaxID=1137799 RepID=UPI00054E65EC|nr:hypothetical protein [Endozoicomonas numazuensis]